MHMTRLECRVYLSIALLLLSVLKFAPAAAFFAQQPSIRLPKSTMLLSI